MTQQQATTTTNVCAAADYYNYCANSKIKMWERDFLKNYFSYPQLILSQSDEQYAPRHTLNIDYCNWMHAANRRLSMFLHSNSLSFNSFRWGQMSNMHIGIYRNESIGLDTEIIDENHFSSLQFIQHNFFGRTHHFDPTQIYARLFPNYE